MTELRTFKFRRNDPIACPFPGQGELLRVHDFAALIFIHTEADECTFIEKAPLTWDFQVSPPEHAAAAAMVIAKHRPVGVRFNNTISGQPV